MLFAAAVAVAASAQCRMPELGTYLEPWYTNRASYHWTFPPYPAATGTEVHGGGSGAATGKGVRPAPAVSALFGDADGDGKDDLIWADGGSGAWTVGHSNGANGWGQPRAWWMDAGTRVGGAATAEHFVADLNGDGLADAATFYTSTAGDGTWWSVGLSSSANRTSGLDPPVVVEGATLGCAGSAARRVSRGALWCIISTKGTGVADGNTATERWGRFDVVRREAAVLDVPAPWAAGTVIEQRWVGQTTPNTGVDDAVAIDNAGNVYVALGSATPAGRPGPALAAFVRVLSNFTATNGAACTPGPLLLAPYSTAVFGATRAAAAAVVCASATSGYWYAAPIAASATAATAATAAAIEVWKYSHGGAMGAERGPRPEGWAPPGTSNPFAAMGGVEYHYADFRLADPFGAGEPSPLACNWTAHGTGMDPTPRCVVMPPARRPYLDPFGFQADPVPDFKDTNINLWQAWHLNFSPLLSTGEFGTYDSADLVQARFMFDRLTALGVTFVIPDNTNGLGCDFGNTLAATKALVALAARYNAAPARATGGATKMHVAQMVGVNPLGSPTDPTTLRKMDAQLLDVWNMFYNSTDADAYAIDGNSGPAAASGAELAGAGYRHPVSGKPLVVLYVEPSFEPRYTAWLKANPASIGNRFHIGFSDGNNWRAGLYGWMIDRSCGPPNTPDVPCTMSPPGVDIGIRSSTETMYVSPSFSKNIQPSGGGKPYHAYAARDIGWYRSQFPVAAKACPTLLIVGAFNDYTEMNGWWPSLCPTCDTGEEADPYLFWNATVAGIAAVTGSCTAEQSTLT